MGRSGRFAGLAFDYLGQCSSCRVSSGRAGSLLDAAALAGYLVPAGSMFAFLAGHRAEVFPDADYADLFSPPGVGRPSLPATQMAAVLTLQALHDYSDRETAEAVKFDVRWKVAIGVALDDPGFDPSSLVYWRRRMAKSERPHRVNDAVKKVIEQTGILKGRRRRAVDSTIVADAVATQDTVTQLVSAIRRVAREVPGAAEQVAAVCTGHDYSEPGKPKIDWEDPAAKDALVSALVTTRTRWWQRCRDAGAGGAGRVGGGAAGAGRRAGRGARRGLRWPGRAVADRPQGRRRPGDLGERSRGPAHPQVAAGPPGRVPRPRGRRARRPGSSPMRS